MCLRELYLAVLLTGERNVGRNWRPIKPFMKNIS
jgi:hypothetical protein